MVVFNESHKPPQFRHLWRVMEFDMTRCDSTSDAESELTSFFEPHEMNDTAER